MGACHAIGKYFSRSLQERDYVALEIDDNRPVPKRKPSEPRMNTYAFSVNDFTWVLMISAESVAVEGN